MTTHCTKTNHYYRDKDVQINSVQRVDNFIIDGVNLGELFIVKTSNTDDQKQEQKTRAYRKNK